VFAFFQRERFSVNSKLLRYRVLGVLTVLSFSGAGRAQNTGLGDSNDRPCGIGEIAIDRTNPGQVLLNIPSRFHFKYAGPLAGGNVSIMIAEGSVFRFVQEDGKMSSTNMGKYLAIQDGDTITIDSGNIKCAITARLKDKPAVIDVNMKMVFLSKPQESNYRLEVAQ
jgi:hypothetical protein